MASKVDIEKLSVDDLRNLARDIEKAIKKREAENFRKAREAADAAAKEFGFSLQDVTSQKAVRRTGERTEVKYRNPEDPQQTWSGRGRQPQWFKDAVAGGRKPEELAA